jgi:transposase InsO family protein
LRPEGHRVSRSRVERLMRRHGIQALARGRFRPTTTDPRHQLPIAPNLLQQKFSACVPLGMCAEPGLAGRHHVHSHR